MLDKRLQMLRSQYCLITPTSAAFALRARPGQRQPSEPLSGASPRWTAPPTPPAMVAPTYPTLDLPKLKRVEPSGRKRRMAEQAAR
eukprot:CAMPEP_0179196492 /NCGR_PEP_ID=MMETSP0796-20121207/97709_1 /TAXON_ID=73915 /ORGANISM="Pyrodinium bahamense, Strain pbaha01" /LENGTH=85 /DNA_ID=CAMNT_0020900907 /DNA_START=87 /DNA_END=344 /DNA_ORIENTATION=-